MWQPTGLVTTRIPDFAVHVVGPGPRFPGWTYVTSGRCSVSAKVGHGREFVLSALADDARHAELVTVAAFYHAGEASQRLDLGHTVPIGAPWMAGSELDHLLVSLPYAYGPDLERFVWGTSHARILSLLPVSTAERDLKVSQGLDVLEGRLDAAGADFANPYRKSTV